jgi:hypothetical protein
MSRVTPQLIVFSYHKTGTSLFLHVMTKVCARLGLTLVNHYGLVERLELEPDVILLPHSTLGDPLDRPYRAIRLIRDPRDIWVSGYLYHRRCDEEWCRNTDMDPTPPIQWPRVDYSFAHWPEDWKRHYLERLGGKSYQQNLLDRSMADGLEFELEGYTGCTLATMGEWTLNGAEALDVKLEDVMADFDGSMRHIFGHFGFTADQSEVALEVAHSEDVRRMDDAAIAARPQIHSRTPSKWRDLLSAAQIARFEERYGDLIRELGYEPAGVIRGVLQHQDASAGVTDAGTPRATGGDAATPDRSQPAQRSDEHSNAPAVVKTTHDAGIRLSADGANIRPATASQGVYTFVVPSGRARVRLESHFVTAVDPPTPDPGGTRRLGVRVSRIAINSDAGDVVIAADNPSLTGGWHHAEREGADLWRWTDGSAELPWDGVSGPAVVTVHCTTATEYPTSDEKARSQTIGDVRTVRIGELAPPCCLVEALHSWWGFAELAAATRSRVAMPYLILQNEPADQNWTWNRVAECPLAPIGCSFLRDVEVSGSGYFFYEGRFVREFVNISDVALQWLRQPDFYDNPLTQPRTNRVVVEEPALLVFGPGSSIYGHWLLDFMPRIVIAQQLLGEILDDFVVPLPSGTPEWVAQMIHTFCGIEPGRIRYYARHDDLLVCRRACLPSYAHSGKRGDYTPHPLLRAFYDQFGNRGAPRTKRRICLSRRNQERHTLGVWRIFEARETMEQMAIARGFEIVQPEELSFPEQVELFRSASCILGEHGSGMHATVFADPGTIVATVGAWNRHQFNIAAAFEHRLICMNRYQVIEGREKPPLRFTATKDDLAGLFEMIDTVEGTHPDDYGRFAPTSSNAGVVPGK